jgi:hypothetical protein
LKDRGSSVEWRLEGTVEDNLLKHYRGILIHYKRTLISLFKKVRELQADPIQNRLTALDVQEELLRCIGRAESRIRRTRKVTGDIKARLSKRGNTRQESAYFKAVLDAGQLRVSQQKTLISVLRSIGDAIPFIYGDRWDLKQFTLKEDAGFITGKRGSRLERSLLRRAFAIGATVVMNDLTHTLRHGDITVFRPDLWPKGGSPFRLLEAKTGRGGNRARAERQKAAAKEIIKYITQDRREVDGYLWERVPASEEPQYHADTFTKLAATLPRCGWVLEEVEPGLHYLLWDGVPNEERDKVTRPLLEKIGPMLQLGVNEMQDASLGYYPFPLSIRDPDVLFRFYNNEFLANVFVSMDQVNAALADRGFRVTITNDVSFPWSASLPDYLNEETGLKVGFYPLGRLASEFIRLDWLLKSLFGGPMFSFLEEYLEGPITDHTK